MEVKFACSDFTFPLLRHDDALTLISMMGFDGVDVGLFEQRSHLQPSDQFSDLMTKAHALRRKTEERGLCVADVFLQTALDFSAYAVNHPDKARREKARDMFKRCLEYTVECGAKHMSALPGVLFDDVEADASYALCLEELAWRCFEASKAGVIFSVEAHIGSIVPTPQAAFQLTEDVPGLTLTLDFTHFIRAGNETSEVLPLIARASHFHARGAARGRLQTVFRENEIDYASVVRVMRETGYGGYVGVEYTWQAWENCDRVDNVSESILMKNHLETLFSGGEKA